MKNRRIGYQILFLICSSIQCGDKHGILTEKWNADAIVQIISHVEEVDICRPYVEPVKHTRYATGFFINEKGAIVTAAYMVENTRSVEIWMPALGDQSIEANVVGFGPDYDFELLQITPVDIASIRETLGSIPFVEMGDSDVIKKGDNVMLAGYPSYKQQFKLVNGTVSGWRYNNNNHIEIVDAPVYSGALCGKDGKVIGLVTETVLGAERQTGYAAPINTLKFILADLQKTSLLRKPHLGILSHKVTDSFTDYLGNPQPGGCYIVEVVKDSPLKKADIQIGDMIYEINQNRLDVYGDMNVDWSEDKISLADYIARLAIGEDLNLVVYRNGERKELSVKFTPATLAAIRRIYPGHEALDYEVFAGMVVMPLTVNHLEFLKGQVPGLKQYEKLHKQAEPVLLISHVFPNSKLAQSRATFAGFTLNEVNEMPVHTLGDFRNALKKSIDTGYVVIKATGQVSLASENIITVLPLDKVLEETTEHANLYHYPISETVQLVKQNRKKKVKTG